MGLLKETLIAITEAVARRIKSVTREKLAKVHEEIARGIRDGKFVAEDAIKDFADDSQKLDDVLAGLPD